MAFRAKRGGAGLRLRTTARMRPTFVAKPRDDALENLVSATEKLERLDKPHGVGLPAGPAGGTSSISQILGGLRADMLRRSPIRATPRGGAQLSSRRNRRRGRLVPSSGA